MNKIGLSDNRKGKIQRPQISPPEGTCREKELESEKWKAKAQRVDGYGVMRMTPRLLAEWGVVGAV